MLIRDIMTREPFTVPAEMSVVDARAEMSRRHLRHLLVTGADGLLVGIVTDRDIRSSLPSPATSLSVWELNYLLARLTVGAVMSRTVLTIDPDRDAREAARIMIDRTIGALPVLEGRRLVGIVTDTDLLRTLASGVGGLAVAG
jgi:acetoin utilization protein AcuB